MKKHRRVLFSAIIAVVILLNPIISTAAAIYNINSVPESQPITIDGYNNESAWENSIFIKHNLPSRNTNFTKYIVLRVLCDVDYLYINAYVADDDRATKDGKPDNVRLVMKQGNYSKDLTVSYTGKALSGGGISAGYDNEMYYVIEARIPFQKKWTSSGEFSLSATVTDNGKGSDGETLSDMRTFSYLFKVNISTPTTKPTAAPTTTKAPTQPPTQTPNTPNTKPPAGNSGTPSTGGSSGGSSTGGNNIGGNTGSNNNVGGSTLTPPPAGGTTAPGETTAAAGITDKTVGAGMTDTSGETITTPEGETITLPNEQGQGGNRALLVSGAVIIAGLIILFAWFALKYYYGSKKNNEEEIEIVIDSSNEDEKDGYTENDTSEQSADTKTNVENNSENDNDKKLS